LNGNRDVAHAAFDAAVKCYPNQRWFLLWGSYIRTGEFKPLTKERPRPDNAERTS
jgi:hypothetical protein